MKSSFSETHGANFKALKFSQKTSVLSECDSSLFQRKVMLF